MGSLFEVIGGDHSHCFFLASILKRPLVQVVVRGFRVQGESDSNLGGVLMMQPDQQEWTPEICTFHQAIHKLCVDCAGSGKSCPSSFDLRVYNYKLNPFAPLLKASLIDTKACLKISTSSSRRTAAQPRRLPFGLKAQRNRPRPKRKTPATTQTQQGRSKVLVVDDPCSEQTCKDIESKLRSESRTHAAAYVDACGFEADVDCKSDHTLSDSEFGDAASENHSDSDTGSEAGKDELAEEMFSAPTVKEEQGQTSKILQQREERLASAAAKVNPAARTYCNKQLGLVEASIQVSARLAGCRHCLLKVERGSPRFAFAYSLTKFQSYLHKDCVLPHLIQEQSDLCQAIEFLESTIQDSKAAQPVHAAAKAVHADLSRHMKSSGSTTNGPNG